MSTTSPHSRPSLAAQRRAIYRLRRLTLEDSTIERRFPFAPYVDTPCAFFRDVLGFEPWAAQEQIANSVATHRRTAVRSGHKIGKSRTAAAISLWWACTRVRGRVILTSTIARQVRQVLWRELRMLTRASRYQLGASPALDPNTGMVWDDERQILGFTTAEPESMAGFSGDQLLFIVDEASGFPQEIYEAVVGNMAGGGSLLVLGNPTRASGFFFDAFRNGRENWSLIHVSSRTTPNVVEGHDRFPGLATREWVAMMDADYGPESPIVKVRVDGEFSAKSDDAVIGLEAVESAVARWEPDAEAMGVLEIGVDVARFGDDDTVIQPRRGFHAYPCVSIHGADTMQVAGRVAAVARQMHRHGEPAPVVRVDVIGIGAGVFDALRRDSFLRVQAVNVAERSRDPDKFCALRDEMWWAARDWLEDGGAIPQDPRLEAELLAPRYSFDTRGRIKVDDKAAIKKRIGRSPDRADALALAVCGVKQADSVGFTTGEGSSAQRLANIF